MNIRRAAGDPDDATYTLNVEPFSPPVMRIYSDASRTVLAAGPFTLTTGASPTQFVASFPSTLAAGLYWLKFSTVFNEGDDPLDDADDTLTLYGSVDDNERFASVPELAAYLRREIDETDPSALLALDMASGSIRSEARQRISYIAGDPVVLRGQWSGDLWLPERPVITVSAVTIRYADGLEDILDDSGYEWAQHGLLRRSSGYWGGGRAVVDVTYGHGFETIPGDIHGLCLQVAGRVFANPENVAQESIGSYSYSVSTAARTGVALTEEERRICWRYRRRTYP